MKQSLLYTTIVALLLMLPTAAWGDVFAVDGIYYYLAGDHAVVSNNGQGNCYSGDIVIPASVVYEGAAYPVTSIGESAFYNCSDVTHVSLPKSVSTIGRWAFAGCRGLSQMTVPDAVTVIDENVFNGCRGLTSITLGKSVTTIRDDAFTDCSALASITIPKSVATIGDYAFYGCTGIKTLFFNAANCEDPMWYSAFLDCPLDSIIFGNHVQHIPAYLAFGQTRLESIIIPKSVTSIGDYAFWGCSGLMDVICLAVTPPTLVGAGLFDDMNYYAHATLHVLPESVQSYQQADYWKDFSQIRGDVVLYTPGDVDADGEITIADANKVVVIIINGGSSGHTHTPDPEGDWINAADVNGDGEVNIADVNAIIDRILNGDPSSMRHSNNTANNPSF